MVNSVDLGGRPFHFIGVGGIGMSALASILARRGFPVSGSDLYLNHITHRLQAEGVHIFLGQEAENFNYYLSAIELEPALSSAVGATITAPTNSPSLWQEQATLDRRLPQVICSTAIPSANPEYRMALELGCPIFHRSDLLAALMQDYRSIAVAGTHGKTTTSSMIGYLLLQAGLDPTIVVGGEVAAWKGNARLGQSPYLVAEADESDGSLVKLVAEIGIITNIELDHPDHYSTLEQVVDTFTTFAQQCTILVGCIDCPIVLQLNPTITYSLEPVSNADYTVTEPTYRATGTSALVWERGTCLGKLNLSLLGRHNLSNALAAVAVGRSLGLDFAEIAPILSTFQGARRRFEHRGEYNRILFIDDYAHHPSEIQATLSAAHLQVGTADRQFDRLIAVFQPHRYSRTQTFLSEFAQSFADADVVVTTDIYAAGEQNSIGLTGEQVAEAIALHHPQVVYQPTLSDITTYLKDTLIPGDLVLFLGAGNLNRVIPDLTTYYQQGYSPTDRVGQATES
ncbi:MAG: UDP-N-acetylmuramate--L-alanine ligase [Leptolyngbyaceae cyanobacterium SL_7_1]|nr:UDP-N-acetylmuramate--L-alanine ligase [Leptolyngbyaceae cyanobacterium SL_7_1]